MLHRLQVANVDMRMNIYCNIARIITIYDVLMRIKSTELIIQATALVACIYIH